MSLLKLPSLLSKPSWTTISSTLNVCSVDESLSFRAFFPRTTEKRRLFWWDLKYKFKRPSDWLTQHLSKASVLIPTYRESSGQLSGPNMPRSDSRHSEKRSPCSCFARRWQPPMGVIPLWQWFRQQSSFASSWCDGHRWSPQLWGKNKLNVAQKAKAWNVSGDDATWPWVSWRGRRWGWRQNIGMHLGFRTKNVGQMKTEETPIQVTESHCGILQYSHSSCRFFMT